MRKFVVDTEKLVERAERIERDWFEKVMQRRRLREGGLKDLEPTRRPPRPPDTLK